MATSQEYSYVTNGLIAFAHQYIARLSPFYQQFIPMEKVPEVSTAVAVEAIRLDEEFRRNHPLERARSTKRRYKRRRK